jgi:hypothetical protein
MARLLVLRKNMDRVFDTMPSGGKAERLAHLTAEYEKIAEKYASLKDQLLKLKPPPKYVNFQVALVQWFEVNEVQTREMVAINQVKDKAESAKLSEEANVKLLSTAEVLLEEIQKSELQEVMTSLSGS